jgi:hypothetical protein
MAPEKKKRKQQDLDRDVITSESISGKRQRVYTEEDAEFAKIYDNLAHEVTKVRIEAAKRLLAKVSSSDSPDVESLAKVLSRLIRGLCSSRKAARSGFFMALTEVLHMKEFQLPNHEIESELGARLLQFVDEGTSAAGQASTQVYYKNLAWTRLAMAYRIIAGEERQRDWSDACLPSYCRIWVCLWTERFRVIMENYSTEYVYPSARSGLVTRGMLLCSLQIHIFTCPAR